MSDAPYQIVKDEEGYPHQPYVLTGPGYSMCFKDEFDAEVDRDNLNLAHAQGQAEMKTKLEKVKELLELYEMNMSIEAYEALMDAIEKEKE